MFSRRAAIVAAFALALGAAAAPHAAVAQPMMGWGDYGRLPMFQANSWRVHEQGGWDSVWTFEGPAHHFMNGVWTNHQTGERRFSRHMRVYRQGAQIIINRPGLGNYVGTIQPGGTSIEGTLSWSPGRFRARVQ